MNHLYTTRKDLKVIAGMTTRENEILIHYINVRLPSSGTLGSVKNVPKYWDFSKAIEATKPKTKSRVSIKAYERRKVQLKSVIKQLEERRSEMDYYMFYGIEDE